MKYVLAFLLILIIPAAIAKPPAGSPGEFASWFESLKQNGSGVSCCSISDCRLVEWRSAKDHYEVYITTKDFPYVAQDHWAVVPQSAILPRNDNPFGRAVACYMPSGEVICFIKASMS